MKNEKNENLSVNIRKSSDYKFEDFEISENEERYRYFKNGTVQKIED
ncbi:MAG: hypothetical protein ABH837_00130 [bacterium]